MDIKGLSGTQLRALADCYDHAAYESLQPLPEMAEDNVRAEIDKTIAAVLRLPDFSTLRSLLAREPVVCLRRL